MQRQHLEEVFSPFIIQNIINVTSSKCCHCILCYVLCSGRTHKVVCQLVWSVGMQIWCLCTFGLFSDMKTVCFKHAWQTSKQIVISMWLMKLFAWLLKQNYFYLPQFQQPVSLARCIQPVPAASMYACLYASHQ